MKYLSFIKAIPCLLLVLISISFENKALAYSTDSSHGFLFDNCGTLSDTGMRFSAYYQSVFIHSTTHSKRYRMDTATDQVSIGIIGFNKSYSITNYYYSTASFTDGSTGTTNFYTPELGSQLIASDFGFNCGLYTATSRLGDPSIATYINDYMMGIDDSTPDINIVVSENHGSSGCDVTVTASTGSAGSADESFITSWHIKFTYDGAILPTRNINNGRDKNSCPTEGCDGMPIYSISQPYLNLWVYDTPVFYSTSQRQEIAFKLNYKQKDTRPKNDGIYPTTGWNHNWYSYVHYDIPIMRTTDGSGSASTGYISARGVVVQPGWTLNADYSQWEAILYSPENDESYLSASQSADPQNNKTMVPLNSGGGYRVIHGDGSQDIYGLSINGSHTYGITRRFGYVFDKRNMSSGPEGVWKLDLNDTSIDRKMQDADDAANYSKPGYSVIMYAYLLNYSDAAYATPDDPALPVNALGSIQVVEYLSGDALLTSRLDPYGNATTLGYDKFANGTFRLKTITDCDHKVTTLNYNRNNCVSSVTMPYGRLAYFTYDSHTNLTDITDAMHLTSSMAYTSTDHGINYHLTSLTTPYGLHIFDYKDDSVYVKIPNPSYLYYTNSGPPVVEGGGSTEVSFGPLYVGEELVNHTINDTSYPNLSKEIYFYGDTNNNNSIPYSFSVDTPLTTEVNGRPLDSGSINGLASLRQRNCFHWGRYQTPLLSDSGQSPTNFTSGDFLLGSWKHYPTEISRDFRNGSGNIDINSHPTFSREVSADGNIPGNITWFIYDNQQTSAYQMTDEPLNWSKIIETPNDVVLETSFTYDSSGRLTGISEPYSQPDDSVGYRNYTLSYGSVGVIEGDNTWSIPYLSSISTPFNTTTITTTPTLATGNVLSWPIISMTDAMGNITTFSYNNKHQLTGIIYPIYPDGLSITNIYDNSTGFLQKSIALQSQLTNTFTFNNGEISSITTPSGLTLNYTYDFLGRLTLTLFPDNTTVVNSFDKMDLVASKNRLGNWKYSRYDNMRQLISQRDSIGNLTIIGHCPCGVIDSITDPVQGLTTYTYDDAVNLIKKTSVAGNQTFIRDTMGRIDHYIGYSGTTLTNTYNYQGSITKIVGPNGTLFQTYYNSDDTPSYIINSDGIRHTYDYDDLKRILSITSPTGIQQFAYSGVFRISSTDANGNITQYGYDSAGRVSTITNANNEETSLNYNTIGTLLSVTDDKGQKTGWAYDIYGENIAETNANKVVVITNGYDVNGKLVKLWTKEKGLTTIMRDANNNVINVIHPISDNAAFTYDGLNRMVSMSNQVGKTIFTYTNFGAFSGAISSEVGPSNTVSFNYSGILLNSTIINPLSDNWQETRSYDNQDRLWGMTSPAGNFLMSYNGAGNQVSTIKMPGSIITNEFDLNGNVKSTSLRDGFGNLLNYHSYSYDAADQNINMVRANGSYVSYSYDSIGQLTNALGYEADNSPRKNEIFGYGYDDTGNLTNRINGVLNQVFVNNNLNLLITVTRNNLLTVSGNGNSVISDIKVNGQESEIYKDNTFATAEGISLTDGINTFNFVAKDALNRESDVTVIKTLPQSTTFTYDNNGNLLSDGTRFFVYDDDNRLIQVYVPNLWKTEYIYDGLSRKSIRKDYSWTNASWTQTNKTCYVYSGNTVIQERSSNNISKVTYTAGAGGFARTDTNGSTFYHHDGNNNITTLVNNNGTVVAKYTYDPYGNLVGKSGPMSDSNLYRFASREINPLSGLYSYQFRFYDPRIQRWINPDPIRLTGGRNMYSFVGNNPINNTDPLGLKIHTYDEPGSKYYTYFNGDDNILDQSLANLGNIIVAAANTAIYVDDVTKSHAPPGFSSGMIPFGPGEYNYNDNYYQSAKYRADTMECIAKRNNAIKDLHTTVNNSLAELKTGEQPSVPLTTVDPANNLANDLAKTVECDINKMNWPAARMEGIVRIARQLEDGSVENHEAVFKQIGTDVFNKGKGDYESAGLANAMSMFDAERGYTVGRDTFSFNSFGQGLTASGEIPNDVRKITNR